jgi:hypothetical protein
LLSSGFELKHDTLSDDHNLESGEGGAEVDKIYELESQLELGQCTIVYMWTLSKGMLE